MKIVAFHKQSYAIGGCGEAYSRIEHKKNVWFEFEEADW